MSAKLLQKEVVAEEEEKLGIISDDARRQAYLECHQQDADRRKAVRERKEKERQMKFQNHYEEQRRKSQLDSISSTSEDVEWNVLAKDCFESLEKEDWIENRTPPILTRVRKS